jgi:glutamate-1-semialdehyde 2,1-aminomutase
MQARGRVAAVHEAELARFAREHPRSRELFDRARGSLVSGVPMTWMAKWTGGHPVYAATAHGATIEDVDGNVYVDFALGDTAAMAGHSPPATIAAVQRRLGDRGGATLMLRRAAVELRADRDRRQPLGAAAVPRDHSAPVRARVQPLLPRLRRRDLRHARRRPATVARRQRRARRRSDADHPGVRVQRPRRRRAAARRRTGRLRAGRAGADQHRHRAPDPGFHDALRAACDRTGTLLLIDETHTISAGPGGCTAAWGLRPDVVTIGKAIAGGIPIGAYGVSAELGARIGALDDADLVDVGGVGGTLAGNALSLAAARATLQDVLTAEAFDAMMALCDRFVAGVRGVLAERQVPWSIVQLGARAELAFTPDPPRTGGASAALNDPELEDALHLFLLNRGVMITPFHNMALMSPATTAADVDRHTEVFAEAVAALA